MRKVLFLMAVVVMVTACKEKIYDVNYYYEHQEEAKSIVEKCKKGEVTDDNCKNAQDGIFKKNGESFQDHILG